MIDGRGYIKHHYLGYIEITQKKDSISSIYFLDEKTEDEISTPLIKKCKKEILEYLEKKRTEFSVKINISSGTDFQNSCWKAMTTIPFGKTISYSEEAKLIGNPKAVRAVGSANGKNPISIIVP